LQDDLAGLAGCLLRRPEPAELDPQGCFSRASTGEVEQLLVDLMIPEVMEFQMPAIVSVRATPLDRWRLASYLQKSIRFGLPAHAMRAAAGLCTADPAYALRRLGVILVEDVMTGSPLLVARTLAVLGQPAMRRQVGERRLVVWIAKLAAEAAKDRSAVELLVCVEHDQSLNVPHLVGLSDQELAEIVMGDQRRAVERIAAAQIMAGPAYRSDRLPRTSHRTPTALFQLMVEMGMTRWGLYVAAKTASRVRDAMFVTIPMIEEWMRTGDYAVVESEPSSVMVGDILGAAYDKYTRQGLMAIRRFMREIPAMQAFMRAVMSPKRRYAGGVGVFLAEGGVLSRRVVYGAQSEAVHQWTRSTERMHWLPNHLAPDFIASVRENLPALNTIRAQILAEDVSALPGTPS
jgi:hypothetical protein